MDIKAIVFDLGGVLLNLNFSKTAEAFETLGVKNFNDYFTQYHAHPLFKQLETGDVVPAGFYDELRRSAEITASDDEINTAWNAMLLDFPAERIDCLEQLKNSYRLFLFSNTNAIHHAAFHKKFTEQFKFNFDDLFEKTWYSHLIAHRKPDQSAFEYIIKDGNLDPSATIFFDDTMPNIEAAHRAGLNAALITEGKDIIENTKGF